MVGVPLPNDPSPSITDGRWHHFARAVGAADAQSTYRIDRPVAPSDASDNPARACSITRSGSGEVSRPFGSMERRIISRVDVVGLPSVGGGDVELSVDGPVVEH